MFGVLNNTMILSGSDVSLPKSRMVLNAYQAQGQLHINQLDETVASGILLSGPDGKHYNTLYNGTGLAWFEDGIQRMVLKNGGNLGIGVANPLANVHIGNDLRVDGNFTVNGSVTTINSISTLTHMLEIENSGSGPAVMIKQTGAMPCLQVYDDAVLALTVADGGYLGINNANPLDWLDVTGSINATGCLKGAWNYVSLPPAASLGNIGTMSGGYMGWNRSGTTGYTVFGNQRGTMSGGWEFVSYTAAGAFNKVSADIDDQGNFRNFGNYASITGSLYVGSNTFFYGTITNYSIAQSIGPSNSSAGPHYHAYFTNETSPAYQRSVWAHDNISNNYDAYFDGNNWRYSSPFSAFQIIKSNSNLYIRPSTTSGVTGGLLSWSSAGIDVAASGMVGINTSPTRMLDVGGDVNVQANLYVLGASTFTGNIVTSAATITTAALNVAGSYASIAGSVAVGTSLLVGSLTSTRLLAVTGSYTSISGVLSVGTYISLTGSQTISGNLAVGSSATLTGFLTVGSNCSIGSSLTVGTDLRVGGQATILGNLAIGSSATVSGFITIGSNITVGSSLAVGTDLRVGGQATITGNLSVLNQTTLTGNMYVGGQSSLSGNLWVGSSATLAGNVRVGTSLTVGSLLSATVLNITGPYASLNGNLWVGTDAIIQNNATISGTVNSVGGLNVGTVQVIDFHGSLLTGVAGAGNISGGTFSGSAFQISSYGSVQGYLNIGTDLSVSRNVNVAQTLTTSNLISTGQYASVSGLLVNNVLGSLLLRGYDESGTYRYSTLSAGQSLPAPFLTRPIAASQLSSVNLNAATVGTLTSQYSMRITGYINPPNTGTYTFQMTYKDGLTVWIGPDKLVDSWVGLSAATTTSSNLVMRQGMWTPILIEHANASAPEILSIQWALNVSSAFSGTVLTHATNSSNFQMAYDMYDVPPALLGTTYISGKTFFGDEAIFYAGLSLPNSLFFSGNVSELANDAGYLQSTPATLSGQAMYVANFASITGTISSYAGSFTSSLYSGGSLTGGNAKLSGLVDIFTASSGGQLRISPATLTGEASIGFYRNANRTAITSGDLWSIGNQLNGLSNGNFVLTTSPGTILTVTPSGSIGINQPSPSANLDVSGTANISSNMTVGGNITMTSTPGQGNLFVTSAASIAGALVVGTASALANVNLYPGIDNKSTCGTSTARWSNMYSYALDVTGNAALTGTLTVGGSNVKQYMSGTSFTVTPTNADKPVINPDAYNVLLINEDGGGTSLNYGSLSGSAIYGTTSYSSQNCVQLTTTTSSTAGSVAWAINPGNSWTLNAEIYTGGGTGGEMIAFFVYSSTASGVGTGYSFTCDEYSNINNGNTSKQFSMNYNGNVVTSINGTAAGGMFMIPLAVWNRLRIVFFRNNVRMYLNNNLVINYKDINRSITGDNTYYCGFYGQCTSNNNFHAVRNVRLNKVATGGWDWVNQTSSDICFPAGNVGINTTTPLYSLDVVGVTRIAPTTTGSALSILNPTLPSGSQNFMLLGSSTAIPAGAAYMNYVAGNTISASSSWGLWGQSTDGIRLTASGTGYLVGVNTNSPAYNLDVFGTSRISSSSDFAINIAHTFSSGANGYSHPGNFINSNLASNEAYVLQLGQNGSAANAAYIGFVYMTSGASTNYATIGLYASDRIMNITAARTVGINTTTPTYTLDVSGTFRSTGNHISNTAMMGDAGFGTTFAAYGHSSQFNMTGYALLADNSGQTYINAAGGNNIRFRIANADQGLWNTTGLGVGTTAPAYKLDVTGSGRFTSVVSVNNAAQTAILNVLPSTGSMVSPDALGAYIFNPNNVAGNRACCCVRTGGASAGSPFIAMDVNNVVGWSVGNDNLDSNKFKIKNDWNFNSNDRLTITLSGLVGILTSSPSYTLDVNGTIRASGDVISNSDIRLKTNIKPLSDSLNKVCSLRGVSFEKQGTQGIGVGLIAQEVREIIPEVVISSGPDEIQAVAYGNIVGHLVEAIKSLKSEIQSLKTEIQRR